MIGTTKRKDAPAFPRHPGIMETSTAMARFGGKVDECRTFVAPLKHQSPAVQAGLCVGYSCTVIYFTMATFTA